MDSKCKNRNYFSHLRCVFIIFSLFLHLLLGPVVRGQYHFSFEKGTESGPDLFPESSWQQSPPDRWRLAEEGAIEGNYSLHHDYDNPESDCDYLIYNHHRPGNSDSLIFSFRVRHGYAPSSSNNWQLAFLADFQKEDMRIMEGIVLGVNFRGSDDLIRIWQCKGGAPTELVPPRSITRRKWGLRRLLCSGWCGTGKEKSACSMQGIPTWQTRC